jgi:hypothetical protein
MLPTLDLSCEENAARLKWSSPLVDHSLVHFWLSLPVSQYHCQGTLQHHDMHLFTYAHIGGVFYGTIERKVNRRLIYKCRCDERLKAKGEGSTRLSYTGLRGGLEHLKIETRLIDKSFASVMG